MNNMRMSLALISIAAFSFATAGCVKSARIGNDEASVKTELVLAIQGEPSDGGFDPTQGWGRYGSPLFQSTLLTRDDSLRIVNDLATGYSVSDDGLRYTVTLRKAKFSDGSELTADDVVFTYETARKSGSVVDLTMLVKAKAIDSETIEFTLKNPSSVFINRLADLGIVPKQGYGPEYAYNPIGSGPYMLVQWDKGQQLIIEANPEYYGNKPYYRKLTFLFLSEDTAFAAAKSGKIDVLAVPSNLAKQKIAGMKLLPVKSVDNRGIGFPMQKSEGIKSPEGNPVGNDVTADKAVRLAINYAVDRKTLVEGALYGYGSPAHSPCDGLPWGNPEAAITDNDPDRARTILAEGGWIDADGDGILEKDSLKAVFTLVYPAGDSLRQALSLAVSDTMKPLGIRIDVEGKSWDEIGKIMHSDAVLWGWGSHDPSEINMIYNSKWAGVEWNNAEYYSNQNVDANLEAAMSAHSEEAAIPYWKAASWDGTSGYSARGDAVYAWLVNIDHVYFVNEKIDLGNQRVQPHGHGWPVTANICGWKPSGE